MAEVERLRTQFERQTPASGLFVSRVAGRADPARGVERLNRSPDAADLFDGDDQAR
jgi:hypothetical protein